MAGDSRPLPEVALEDVAYLSRSANRVRILETLADGPHTRRELMDATGVSRTTLGRILNELAERGWTERNADGRYAATRTGEHVAASFLPLIDAMATVRSLGEAARWLPASVHDVGIDAFRDATVHRPNQNTPASFAGELVERIGPAREVRTLTYLAPPEHSVAELLHDRIRDAGVDSELVLAGGLADHIAENPERRDRWRTDRYRPSEYGSPGDGGSDRSRFRTYGLDPPYPRDCGTERTPTLQQPIRGVSVIGDPSPDRDPTDPRSTYG